MALLSFKSKQSKALFEGRYAPYPSGRDFARGVPGAAWDDCATRATLHTIIDEITPLALQWGPALEV
jgi:hypothetical protein